MGHGASSLVRSGQAEHYGSVADHDDDEWSIGIQGIQNPRTNGTNELVIVWLYITFLIAYLK